MPKKTDAISRTAGLACAALGGALGGAASVPGGAARAGYTLIVASSTDEALKNGGETTESWAEKAAGNEHGATRMLPLCAGKARGLILTLGLGLAVHLVSPPAAAALDLATGLQAAIGIDFDAVNQHLYFVEYNAGTAGTGTVKRVVLTPICDNPAATPESCTVETVYTFTGLAHPEDVAVDPAAGVAYVTTRDFLAPDTGALYAFDLTGGLPATPSLVAFNLRAPHQIVLDPPTHSAWVVSFGTGAPGSGRVWHIDLATGAKVAVITGLNSPVGLAVSSYRTKAYVTEQGPSSPAPADIRLSEFDLATGSRIRDLVTGASAGLTAPFFLRWTDPSEGALYVVERDPANRASRTDLVAGATLVALPGLPFRPSGIAVNIPSGAAYVTTNDSVVRVELVTVPPSQPVFLTVGWIPSTYIDANGYASYAGFLDAPFGGTLDIFGNLSKFWGWGARAYSVEVDKDGAGFNPVNVGWTVQKYNVLNGKFEPQAVAPIPTTTRYAIPLDYNPGSYTGYLWQPSALALKWPSSADGLYTFRFQLFNATGGAVTIPANEVNLLTLRVDNSAPEVDLKTIVQILPPATDVDACAIVSSGANSYQFRIIARDASHHFLSYRLYALWGKNGSDPNIAADTYSPSHVNAEGPYAWSGPAPNALVPAAGWAATCNCAHTFILDAWKRTTNGYWYILSARSHQSITINNTGTSCP